MNNITKQIIFASILFICTAVVVCVHLFGSPYTVPYEEISFPETTFIGNYAVMPSQSTRDNVKEATVTSSRMYGALHCTSDCTMLLITVKIMLMLSALCLFIKPERYDVEFILDSDGMK